MRYNKPRHVMGRDGRYTQGRDCAERCAYTVAEFMVAFRLSRSKTYAEMRAGRLPSYRVGKRRFTTVRAAVEWQRSCEDGKWMG